MCLCARIVCVLVAYGGVQALPRLLRVCLGVLGMWICAYICMCEDLFVYLACLFGCVRHVDMCMYMYVYIFVCVPCVFVCVC